MRRFCVGVGLAVLCLTACAAVPAAAAELVAYLSAPATSPVGQDVTVQALIANRSDKAVKFTYQAEVSGLTVDKKTLKRHVWLGGRACLSVRWTAQAAKPGEARFALSIDGQAAAQHALRIVAARETPVVSEVVDLTSGPATIALPEPGVRYEIEITMTAGARGELAAMLAGLRQVHGFDTNAIVARQIAPVALGDPKTADLGLLAALQHASGGWGPTPMDGPTVRTTSWVTFWLGRLARAGGKVDAKMLDAAIRSLRKNLRNATTEMRTRILTALAANGKATREDLALIEAGGIGDLSRPGRLLAVSAGAALPLPVERRWGELSVIETAALVLCLKRAGRTDVALPHLPRLVKLRTATPKFGTHPAVLYALALAELAEPIKADPDAPEKIRVRLSGDKSRTLVAISQRPFARLTFTALAAATTKPTLTISKRSGSGKRVFCRVVVRPAK